MTPPLRPDDELLEAPSPDYRIVDRDGLLVVEPNAPGERPQSRSARFTGLTRGLQDLGLKLFVLRYSPDRVLAGKAIVRAERLPDMISVDAPVDALYYVTRQQQILLGYLVLPKLWFAVIVAMGALASQVENPVWFALFLPLALAASGGGLWLWNRLLAIRQQFYRTDH